MNLQSAEKRYLFIQLHNSICLQRVLMKRQRVQKSMAYPELQQTFNMDLFVTIVNSWKSLTIVTSSSILDIWRVLDSLLR